MISGFPGSSAGKESACNAGDSVSILVRKIPWRRDSPPTPVFLGFPGGSDSKESACNVGDLVLIPGLGGSLGGGHGNPLQYSYLENLHGQRSLAGYSPWGHKESDTTERLSTSFQTEEAVPVFIFSNGHGNNSRTTCASRVRSLPHPTKSQDKESTVPPPRPRCPALRAVRPLTDRQW